MRRTGADSARSWRTAGTVGVLAAALVAVGCAPGVRVLLPTATAGTPGADVNGQAETALRACRGITSFTAEIGVAGRLGREKVRGRLLVGFDAGGRVRLEALAPFGQPVFVLVADGGIGTLLLPRDRRVVRDVAADELLAAVAGIRANGDDLKSLLTGCLVADGDLADGRRLEGGWSAVTLAGGRATAFLRLVGGDPRVVSGIVTPRGGGDVFHAGYDAYGADGLPRSVRLERPAAASPLSLQVTLRDIGVNEPLGAAAFEVVVPGDAVPMTLADLQASSPLSMNR
jgi:hypothetical protein